MFVIWGKEMKDDSTPEWFSASKEAEAEAADGLWKER